MYFFISRNEKLRLRWRGFVIRAEYHKKARIANPR